MHQNINPSIGCTVHECKYHAQTAEKCSLNEIKVVKHENNATTKECTDCGSFEIKH